MPDRAPLPTDPAALPPTEAPTLAALEPLLGAAGLPPLADAERAAIAAHLRLLDAWNPSINLTRIVGPAERAQRHLLDSLVALPLIERLLPPDGGRIGDLGAGGGFPGVPVAARLLGHRDTATLDLIEATQKKARFLEAVAAASGLAPRLRVRAARAESLARPGGPRYDVVTARAVAPLAELARLALPLLAPGGWLAAWKRAGEGWEAELATATSLLGAGRIRIEPIAAPGLEGGLIALVGPATRV